MQRRRLGLIVNPIAGIGGRVGLKGSDGEEIQELARRLGGVPAAPARARGALNVLRPLADRLELLTGSSEMGEWAALQSGFAPCPLPVPQHGRVPTTGDDTRRAARLMVQEGVDLILFAGGDGTAKDIYAAVGHQFPALGIPAGVKIYSAVFAVSAVHAGELAKEFLTKKRTRLQEAEVLDLDETSLREGRIITRLFGYLTIPYRREHVQNQKTATPATQSVQADAIAADVVERLLPGHAYLLGPGTTTGAVARILGIPKTLVGVDIISREGVIALDVSEKQILDTLAKRPLGMIVAPTGGQGFLFGRGNLQISPEVIRLIGKENISVINLASKIAALRGRPLLVDTGEPDVDHLLNGYWEIITGYREKIIYRVSNGR